MWLIIGFCKQHLLWIFLLNYTHFAVYMVFKSQREKKNEIKFQIVGNMQEALETQKQNRMRKYGWRIIILYGIREMKSQIKMHLNWIYWQAAISMALNVMGLMFLICLSSFRVFFFIQSSVCYFQCLLNQNIHRNAPQPSSTFFFPSFQSISTEWMWVDPHPPF